MLFRRAEQKVSNILKKGKMEKETETDRERELKSIRADLAWDKGTLVVGK